MKVCLIPTMFPRFKGDYYGPFIFNEAKALVNNGYEVHVVTPHNEGALYGEIIDGIHVHRFRWWEPKPFKALVYFHGVVDYIRLVTYFISLFFNLLMVIRKNKIEIIHAHSVIPTGFVAAIISRLLHIPLYITAHGMDVYNFEDFSIFRLIITFSFNTAVKAIAVSSDLVKTMERLDVKKDKIYLLINAVDTSRFKPKKNNQLRLSYDIKDEDILILFVGYLDVFKGIYETIEAFKRVQQENNNIKLMMAGDGPKKDELKSKIKKWGLEDKVVFAGEVDPAKIHENYQSADIFLLPSHVKGIPVVVIEAMACGLPVVVSNTEIINDGINGFLVPINDSKIIGQKLGLLINDENLRKKFREESIKTIDSEFNIDKKVKKLIKLYKGY